MSVYERVCLQNSSKWLYLGQADEEKWKNYDVNDKIIKN